MRHRRRDAFTLIELLVVMGIIAVLAGLVWMIGPALQRTERASRGGSLLQGQLFISKQQALRDRTLYGIRLIQDPDLNFRSMQYITQPQDYVRNRVQVDASNRNQVFFADDISDGLADASLWSVQVGDYLQIQNEQQPKLITKITPRNAAGVPFDVIQVQTAYKVGEGPDTFFSAEFKVMRSPRPVQGEAIIQMPDDVVIMAPNPLTGSQIDPNPTTGKYDILFSPSGPVIGSAARRGKIILWVRDTTMSQASGREQTLIVVFTRSGAIASYPVDTSLPPTDANYNPFSFTFDPRPNGM